MFYRAKVKIKLRYLAVYLNQSKMRLFAPWAILKQWQSIKPKKMNWKNKNALPKQKNSNQLILASSKRSLTFCRMLRLKMAIPRMSKTRLISSAKISIITKPPMIVKKALLPAKNIRQNIRRIRIAH